MKQNKNTPERVVVDLNEAIVAMLGLKDVGFLSLVVKPNHMVVNFEQKNPQRQCPKCGTTGQVHERPKVTLHDSHKLHMPFKLCWRKHVFVCVNNACELKTWTSSDDRIAPQQSRTTTRAGKQMTREVASKRSVKEVAIANNVSSKTVDKHLTNYANQLFDVQSRQLRKTKKIGIDETHLGTVGPYKQRLFTTNVVDLETGALIEILEGKKTKDVIEWFLQTPTWWRDAIEVVALDMCPTYKLVAETIFPNAHVVVDRFHVVKLASQTIDAMRNLVDPLTKDHTRKDSAIYKARKTLRVGMDKLSDDRFAGLFALLGREDPNGYLTTAYLNKEGIRRLYALSKEQATELIEDIATKLCAKHLPDKLRTLGKTLKTWKHQILAWHDCHLTNGKTEAVNNHIKAIKRMAYGFANFAHFRARVLLTLGKPDMNLLRSLKPL